ncbi:acyltransferase family protein [Salinicoccus sp. HZC-1]|uniref:acyltransferase family protein n=1 Tax=Salinicoccus sp. HZC-1 TaxID=3385497 RepID=UPI00398ACD79
MNIRELPVSFITGGWGPGSYFVPIIIQATLILPLIYLIMKKNLNVMTFVLFIISLILELICLWMDISRELYRIIVVRYVFALTLGVWLAFNYKKINYRWLLPPAGLSLIYITGANYYDLELIMEPVWLSQHAPAYFYTLLFTIVCLKIYKIKDDSAISRISIKIGQASYHIFLTQMVYFWVIPNLFAGLPLYLYITISVVLCFAAGVAFFELENSVRKKLKSV